MLTLLVGGIGGSGWGQKAPGIVPLRAELTAPLDAGWAKAGTRVRARAVHEWAGPGCHLRENDIIEGHVSEVVRHSKSAAISTMHVVFDEADCDHRGVVGRRLALVALIAPGASDVPISEAGLGKAPPVLDLPLQIGGPFAPMRSAETAASINRNALTGDLTAKDPAKMTLGQVIGMPGTKLQIAGGVEGGSIVSAVGKDARLEGRTTLILLAVRSGPAVAPAVAPAAGSGRAGSGSVTPPH